MAETKLKTQAIGAYLNAPQGFLLNGKIVPSVASNDLTVAIKNLAGNDPSASDPVYCRIGDTVRSITSALTVTKADGTNWFNSGGAELATKEVDYFVYLGYNATDGVVIGFARIPFANEYDDFSTTSTNEKYCAISTITNAAAGDDYENVGRFAATLSAGAGYTWTVPTFTAKNLIQRPIYDTRWLAFTPTFTGMVSQPGATQANYMLENRILSIQYVPGATAASNATTKTVTLPFKKRVTTEEVVAFAYEDNSAYGATISNHAAMNGGSAVLTLYKSFYGTAWTSSGNWRFFPPIFSYDI